MSERKKYSFEEVESLAEQAAQNAMNHFRYGLTCSECVLKGVLDLGISDLPEEIVALSSGFGGGMGETFHTCGAVNGGMMAIGSVIGRKNPYAKETFEERVDELHNTESGLYPIHGKYIKKIIKEKGTIECRDMSIIYDMSTPEGKKERARMCNWSMCKKCCKSSVDRGLFKCI